MFCTMWSVPKIEKKHCFNSNFYITTTLTYVQNPREKKFSGSLQPPEHSLNIFGSRQNGNNDVLQKKINIFII